MFRCFFVLQCPRTCQLQASIQDSNSSGKFQSFVQREQHFFGDSKPICWLRLYSLFASSTPWDSPISTWKLQTPETVSCFNGRVYIHRRYELDHFKRPIEEDVSSIPWVYLKIYFFKKKLIINLIVFLEWIEYDSSSDSIWTCQTTLTFLMVIQWPW